MSTASHHKPPAVWRLTQEIGREGEREGEFTMAVRIAVFDNGVMAVINYIPKTATKSLWKLYFFSKDGVYQSTLQCTNPTLRCPCYVAITSQQNLVVVDQSNLAKIFNIHGSYIRSINTLTSEEDPSTWVNNQMHVSVTCNNEIIIAYSHNWMLTVHREIDGWQPRKIKLDIQPIFLSTSRQGHILLTGRKVKGKPSVVKALTTSGQEVYTIDAFRVYGKVGDPQGLVCDEMGYVYIAVMRFNEKIGKVASNSGHIHQYDHRGNFMKCIIQGIYRPLGLAISKSGTDLYVANEKSVLKYSAT